MKIDLERAVIVHVHKGVHESSCKSNKGSNHVYEVNLEEGTGIEVFKDDFREKVKELAIRDSLLTGLQIWNKVRKEMVAKDVRLGCHVPDSKTVSEILNTVNMFVVMLYI